jgi:uncharacterized protein with GYD domain
LVEPFDQLFPVAFDEVKVTDPPEQKVVAPLALIVGVDGTVFTETVVGIDVALHVPLETVTV